MYEYRAIVKKVYDGDTITVDIDLGFDIWMKNKSIRLAGIDTPEIRGEERPEGLVVKDIVLKMIPVGSEVILKTEKDATGKYGRYLAEVWKVGDFNSLNEWLLDNGYAEPYL